MIKKYFALSIVTASMVVAGCSSDDDDNPVVDPVDPVIPDATPGVGNSVYDNIFNDETLSQLLAAIDAAGLANTLDNEATPFTVFAPNNDAFTAFEAVDPDTDDLAALLADPATLAPILTFHVLSGTVDAAAATAAIGTDQTTVNGAVVAIAASETSPAGLSVGGADVLIADSNRVAESVGVVHIIGALLTPPVAPDPDPDPGPDPTPGAGANLAALEAAGNYTSFLGLLETAGLKLSIDDAANVWTVFAPTDAAVAAAASAPNIQDHIDTSGRKSLADLFALSELTTNAGNTYAIGGTAAAPTIGGAAITDLSSPATGTVIYTLDGALIPAAAP